MAKKKQRVLYAFTNPEKFAALAKKDVNTCLLYTSPSPRD